MVVVVVEVDVGGRVGGLLRPPVARVPATAPVEVRDDAVVPVVPVRRAVAVFVAALVFEGVSGDTGVDSLEEGAMSELCETSMFSLSAIMNAQLSKMTVVPIKVESLFQVRRCKVTQVGR